MLPQSSGKKPALDIMVLDGLMGKHGQSDEESAEAAPDSEGAEGEDNGKSSDPAACLDRLQEELDKLKASLMRG